MILLNQRGELTEGCATNLVLQRGAELLTPALHCGLLPGTLPEELLQLGALKGGGPDPDRQRKPATHSG